MTYCLSVNLDINHAHLQGSACFLFYHYTLYIYMQDSAAINFMKQACAHGPGNKRCISLWHFSYILLTQNNTESAISYNVWVIYTTCIYSTLAISVIPFICRNASGKFKTAMEVSVQKSANWYKTVSVLTYQCTSMYHMKCLLIQAETGIQTLVGCCYRSLMDYITTNGYVMRSTFPSLSVKLLVFIPPSDSSLVLPEDYWKSCGVNAPESCVSRVMIAHVWYVMELCTLLSLCSLKLTLVPVVVLQCHHQITKTWLYFNPVLLLCIIMLFCMPIVYTQQ